MRAVARMIATYYFGVASLRWFSLAGLALIIYGAYGLMQPQHAIWLEAWAFAGAAAFFLGSALMPLTFGTLMRSRQVHLLPYGRTKLLVSALTTIAVTALPLPVLSVLAMMSAMPRHLLDASFYGGGTLGQFLQSVFFWQMYLGALFACTWLYVALWFVTSNRTAGGLMRSLVVLIGTLVLPPAYVGIRPDASLVMPVVFTTGSWVVLIACCLCARRLERAGARLRTSAAAAASFVTTARYRAGRELALVLGTSRPWMLAAVQVVPILLATLLIESASVWLFYLTILSTVSGAVAGNAAVRSRTVWLRSNLSRAQLFSQAERLFWQHNGFVLGVLLLLLGVIGGTSGMPPKVIFPGVALLALGITVSMYLGLMMTKGLRWPEMAAAAAIMLLLMTSALLIAAPSYPLYLVGALEIVVGIAALVCRFIARYRWKVIDWAQCRSGVGAAALSR